MGGDRSVSCFIPNADHEFGIDRTSSVFVFPQTERIHIGDQSVYVHEAAHVYVRPLFPTWSLECLEKKGEQKEAVDLFGLMGLGEVKSIRTGTQVKEHCVHAHAHT